VMLDVMMREERNVYARERIRKERREGGRGEVLTTLHLRLLRLPKNPKLRHDLRHRRAVGVELSPHRRDEVDDFASPLTAERTGRGTDLLATDIVVDGLQERGVVSMENKNGEEGRTNMLVLPLEGVALDRLMPLQDLPEDETDRVDVDLLVVPRVRGPQLGRLPIDGSDERPNHRLGRRLDPREAKVGNLGDSRSSDEDVRALDVAVDDGGFAEVEVLDSVRDAEHVRLANVVEEVTVGAEFGDDHDGDGRRLWRDGDADEVDDVLVAKVAEESKFFDVHIGEVTSDVADGNGLLAVDALVDVL
jgi:hypothetical protein